LALAVVSTGGSAQDVQPPHLSFAAIDWPAAIASLPIAAAPPTAAMSARSRLGGGRTTPPALARLNGVMSQQFAGLATSPVPVLLPFDVAALLRDRNANLDVDAERYYSGFHAARFFYAGPAGYDAAFAIRASDIPEFADIKFANPIEVQISGSALLYNLDAQAVVEGQPVPGLDEDFPGIRKMVLEHHLRYTFVRFGVPYVVSIICFDAGVSRYKMPTCRSADQVAQRFLRALRVVGGTPRNLRATAPLPIERPERVSRSFGYFGPGQLVSGGSRSERGRADYTVYSQIRFPLADVSATAHSEMFYRRSRPAPVPAADADESAAPIIPWRDNFCERRGFPVGQCPAGIGHQGQDLRPGPCKPPPGADRCTHRGHIVAVRDGVILRSARQEAAYLFVNSANEHIRFRYLHMNPRKMDADNLLNGRRVHEGEIIGEVSNFSMKENGTSYHLHFDIQVPTRYGWVFVSPYMTLVTAYERLIGERGTELGDPRTTAAADPSGAGGNRMVTAAWCFTNPQLCSGSGAATTAVRTEPDRPHDAKETRKETKDVRPRRKARSAKSKLRLRQRVAQQDERGPVGRPADRQE
jgi:murein DD-endopeptidase MepM/ murein hydrolase activator NlpD